MVYPYHLSLDKPPNIVDIRCMGRTARPGKRRDEMTLYIHHDEHGELIGRVTGDTNEACEAKANDVFGSNDVSWSYSQEDPLEFDGNCQDIVA